MAGFEKSPLIIFTQQLDTLVHFHHHMIAVHINKQFK